MSDEFGPEWSFEFKRGRADGAAFMVEAGLAPPLFLADQVARLGAAILGAALDLVPMNHPDGVEFWRGRGGLYPFVSGGIGSGDGLPKMVVSIASYLSFVVIYGDHAMMHINLDPDATLTDQDRDDVQTVDAATDGILAAAVKMVGDARLLEWMCEGLDPEIPAFCFD